MGSNKVQARSLSTRLSRPPVANRQRDGHDEQKDWQIAEEETYRFADHRFLISPPSARHTICPFGTGFSQNTVSANDSAG
jgi:hypothetical protein